VNVELVLFAVSMGALFLAMLFYIIFGQITVRKLRKNPKTKNELGVEFVSGWDILNVAGALAMPRWINRKFQNTPLAFLYANAEILDENTNFLDRILATIFYALFVFSGSALIVLGIMHAFGVFD